jgi:hypothetical protein
LAMAIKRGDVTDTRAQHPLCFRIPERRLN